MTVDSLEALEEELIWIERHGAKLIEVRAEQEKENVSNAENKTENGNRQDCPR